MAELQPWMEKAIGRKRRYSKSNVVVDGVIRGGKYVGIATAGFIADRIVSWATNYKKSNNEWGRQGFEIRGKTFVKPAGVIARVGYSVSDKVADTVKNTATGATESYLSSKVYYPDGKGVVKGAFVKGVEFDEDMGTQMWNSCGYTPDFTGIIDKMKEDITPASNRMSDVEWRREVMPYILQTSYRTELNKMFEAMGTRHMTDPDGTYNQEVMIKNMRDGALMLGALFQDFSQKMANNTEYLEAPLTFTKQPPPSMPEELSPEEEKAWKGVKQHSLLESDKQLEKMITAQVAKTAPLTAERAATKFYEDMMKPLIVGEKTEPYAPNIDREEDMRRFFKGALVVRELKRKYASRSIFGKYLTPSGWRERGTLADLTKELADHYQMSKDVVEQQLDLKKPLEEKLVMKDLLNIEQRQRPKRQVTVLSSITTGTKNLAVGAKNLAVGVGNLALSAGKGLYQGTSWFGSKVKGLFSWGGKQEPKPVEEVKAQPVKDGPKKPVEEVKSEEVKKDTAEPAVEYMGEVFHEVTEDLPEEQPQPSVTTEEQREELSRRQTELAKQLPEAAKNYLTLAPKLSELFYYHAVESAMSGKQAPVSPEKLSEMLEPEKVRSEAAKIAEDPAFGDLLGNKLSFKDRKKHITEISEDHQKTGQLYTRYLQEKALRAKQSQNKAQPQELKKQPMEKQNQPKQEQMQQQPVKK